MKKCKYCNNKEPIWNGSTWKINISSENKELEIECDLETFEYINIDIKYCPFCGRKI